MLYISRDQDQRHRSRDRMTELDQVGEKRQQAGPQVLRERGTMTYGACDRDGYG